MTDSSALLANAQALSSDVLYNLKPSVVRCRSYRASVPPSNSKSAYVGGDTVICYVPARRNCFLDTQTSYIRMTAKNMDGTNTLTIDSSAASFCNRLDVYHGSNLCESIQQYNVLHSALLDVQTDSSVRAGLEATYGCKSDRSGTVIAAGAQATFCIPILSGVIGVLNDKFLPLSLADDIRCEFTLETNLAAMVASTSTPIWNLINFELVLNILELSDEGMRMVQEVTPFSEPIFIHGTSYRHTSATLAVTAQGAQTILVPARFASLKSLICVPRCNTEIASATSYSISSHVNPGIQTCSYRVGSLQIPQKPLTLYNTSTTGGYAEGMAETLRAFHVWTDVAFAPSITRAQYNVADVVDGTYGAVAVRTAGSTSNGNAFFLAQELESISNRNDTILSGLNSLNLSVFHDVNLGSANLTAAYTLNYFANYDHIIVLDPTGLLSVKF